MPPIFVFSGLSFPAVFIVIMLTFMLLWLVKRLLIPTGLYDLVWHPMLFDAALYCCLLLLLTYTIF